MAVLAKPTDKILVIPEADAKKLFGKPTDKAIIDKIMRSAEKFRKNNLTSNGDTRK